MSLLLRLVVPAQIFEPPIPSVGPTPFLERWVTGSGIPGAALMLGLAVIAFLALSRSGRARMAFPVAAGLCLVGGVVLGIGQFVETPRESLRRSARALVDAAVAADRPALTLLLHPDARVRTRFASAEGRENILPLADRAAGRIAGHDVREVRVDLRGPRVARTQVRLSLDADTLPPASWWAVDWQKTTPDAPWVVTSIEPIWIQGMTDPAGP
jgi:hypothetical protein